MFTPLTQHLPPLLDRLGNWNPQLLREWKGNLKPLTTTLAVVLSLVVQMSLVFCFSLMLPQPVHPYNLYRTPSPRLEFELNGDVPVGAIVEPEKPPFLKISEVIPVEVVFGTSTLVPQTQQKIEVGDRVVSINNQPVPDRALSSADPYSMINWANEQLGYSNQQITSAQFQQKASLGSPVTLELASSTTGKPYRVTLPIVAASSYQNSFCITVSENDQTCEFNEDRGTYETNWIRWYISLFLTDTVILGGVLVGIGGFMIFNDLAQEQRRCTFNFLRMSPRSPLSIVLGKILGVPAPVYLSVLLALPLHCLIGLTAGLSATDLLTFYLVFTVQLLLFYSCGFLLTLVYFGVVNFQAWLYTALGLILGGGVTLMTLLYNTGNTDNNSYFACAFLWAGLFSPAMPLLYALDSPTISASWKMGIFPQFYMGGQSLSLAAYVLASLFTCGFIIAIVYVAIDRKFHNPSTTWIPRRFSYGLTIVSHLSLLLFAIPNLDNFQLTDDGSLSRSDWILLNSLVIFIFTSLYLSILSYALTPSRQLLLDWLRFKGKTLPSSVAKTDPTQVLESPRRPTRKLGLQSTSFFVDCHSPLPALLLNLFVAEALFIVWLILIRNYLALEFSLQIWLAIIGGLALFSGTAIHIFLISQIFVVAPFRNSQIWAKCSIIGTIVAHPTLILTSYFYLSKVPESLWLALKPEAWAMVSTLFLQCLGILGLGLLHQRQLRHAARSEWQDLLTGNQGRMPQTL